MVKELILKENKIVPKEEDESFNLADVCLALVKSYAAKNIYSVQQDVNRLVEANGLDYFLVMEDKNSKLVEIDYGFPGNFQPQRVRGTEKLKLYTVNFYGSK